MLVKDFQTITPEEFDTIERDERFNYELLDGIVMMSPSPSRDHQKVASNLHFHFRDKLRTSKCETLFELDIKFNNNVIKPDIMVFCDDTDDIPVIVIEILSPSTKRYDMVTKVTKYEEMGIQEYWIADPKVKTVIVHDFVNATTELYGMGDTIESKAIPEVIASVEAIFAGLKN